MLYLIPLSFEGERHWLGWAILQAIMHSAHRFPQKKAATHGGSIPHAFLTTFVVGLFQLCVGLAVNRFTGARLWTGRKHCIGSCLFGIGAFAAMTCGNISFYLGGTVGVVTFLATMSIIPGTLIDMIFFGQKLRVSGWLGIGVFLVAGYSILDWPSLHELQQLPVWVWPAAAIPVINAINEGVTRSIKDVDLWTQNFWGGSATVVCCVGALSISNSTSLLFSITPHQQALWAWSLLLGVCVVGIWVFNLISYRNGATIALKKFTVSTVYLVLAMLLGVLVFGEHITLPKVIALCLYPLAYLLLKHGTWQALLEKTHS